MEGDTPEHDRMLTADRKEATMIVKQTETSYDKLERNIRGACKTHF